MRAIFLAVVLVSVLAGCMGVDSDVGPGSVETLAMDEVGTITVEEDQFIHFDFELMRGGRYEFSVRVNSGPNIDLLLVDELNYQQYTAGNAFTYYGSCSRAPMNVAAGSCTLDARQWYIILDNTDSGEAKPPFNGVSDVAVVQYDLKIYT